MKPQATYIHEAGKGRLIRAIARFTGCIINDMRTRHGHVEVEIGYFRGRWLRTDLLLKHVSSFGKVIQ